MTADTPKVIDPIEIPSNATFDLSRDCGGGNGGAAPDGARLALWRLQDGKRHGSVRAFVQVGQLFPACGKFYRLVGVLPRGGIVIDRAPALLPKGVSIQADSVVVPLKGTVELGSSTVTVESIGAAGQASKQSSATLAIKEVEFAKGADQPPTRSDSRKIEIAAGDGFTLLGASYTVVAIRAADPANRLPAWVELAPRPTR